MEYPLHQRPPSFFHLLPESGEVLLDVLAHSLAAARAAAAGTAGAAAALLAAAVRPAAAAGAGGQAQVAQRHQRLVFARQGTHQRPLVAFLPAHVVQDDLMAVERDLDVEDLQRQAELAGQAPTVLEQALAAL